MNYSRTIIIVIVHSPPSFKSATQMSRTQLKQQLMKEQLQEQERKEAELRAQIRKPPPAPALKVPIQSIGIDVPPQVLQVRINSRHFRLI